jgi:hypothetical protein
MMDQKIKKKWIKALRSGEYEQGIGRLHYDGKYCCLGVLMAVQGASVYPSTALPPDQFRAKLSLLALSILAAANDGQRCPYIKMNKHTFKQIADYLKSEPGI